MKHTGKNGGEWEGVGDALREEKGAGRREMWIRPPDLRY